MLSRKNLRNYQTTGVEYIKNVPKCNLWVSMGLGKTVTVLTAIVDLFATFEISKVLIIAPKRVAEHTWPSEIGNWDHTKDLTHSLLSGTLANRKAKLREKTDIHIIGLDNVKWLVMTLGQQWDYDMVVIDESSSFKSHKSQRFKALRIVVNKVRRHVNLTGTPAPNGLLDVWAPNYFIDQGLRLERNITRYRRKYFFQAGGFFQYKLLSEHHAEQIYQKLDDVCFTIKNTDFAELPPIVHNKIDVDLPPKYMKLYKELEREFYVMLEDGEEVEAPFAAALQNKLLQVCNGAVYTEEGKYSEIHNVKLEALESIVDECAGAPILCAYNFVSDKERIEKKFGKLVTTMDSKSDTVEIVDKWNRGEIPILLCHPASAGHGLNLQYGGFNLVWFGMQWNLEYYLQFNARLARPGQPSPHVVQHQIAVRGTVESKVFNALNNKNLTQEQLLEYMKKPIDG